MFIRLGPLSADEVHMRSYGRVQRPTFPAPQKWEEKRGTLFDPTAFGPEQSWTCSCEKMRGEANEEMICDECGTRVGDAPTLRRTRFGHIDLCGRIAHPLSEGSTIGAIPVLPIAFRHDRGEDDLDYLYARVVEGNAKATTPMPPSGGLETAVRQLFANDYTSTPPTMLQNSR